MWYNGVVAIVAQLVEQLIRNEQVTGSIPANGSISNLPQSGGLLMEEVGVCSVRFVIRPVRSTTARIDLPANGSILFLELRISFELGFAQ